MSGKAKAGEKSRAKAPKAAKVDRGAANHATQMLMDGLLKVNGRGYSEGVVPFSVVMEVALRFLREDRRVNMVDKSECASFQAYGRDSARSSFGFHSSDRGTYTWTRITRGRGGVRKETVCRWTKTSTCGELKPPLQATLRDVCDVPSFEAAYDGLNKVGALVDGASKEVFVAACVAAIESVTDAEKVVKKGGSVESSGGGVRGAGGGAGGGVRVEHVPFDVADMDKSAMALVDLVTDVKARPGEYRDLVDGFDFIRKQLPAAVFQSDEPGAGQARALLFCSRVVAGALQPSGGSGGSSDVAVGNIGAGEDMRHLQATLDQLERCQHERHDHAGARPRGGQLK